MKPMQSMFRSSARDKGVPSLNMASMPDLIFTVLFFFMIVTHMRSDEVKVRLQVPQGTEVQKLANRPSVVNVYASFCILVKIVIDAPTGIPSNTATSQSQESFSCAL